MILNLLEAVDDWSQHTVYFDNFFTSYSLLRHLGDTNMRATGTVRDNRTSNCPLLTVAETSKRDKDFYDYRIDGSAIFCRWKDNAAFTIGSNFERVNPVGKAKRWSKRERKYVTIPQPALVNSYNQRIEAWIYWISCLDRTGLN